MFGLTLLHNSTAHFLTFFFEKVKEFCTQKKSYALKIVRESTLL